MTIPIRMARTALLIAALALGCSSGDDAGTGGASTTATKPAPSPPGNAAPDTMPAAAPAEMDPEALVARGQQVYRTTCIACHNFDPERDGALGPAVAGASLPLLEARVLRAEYPDGYTPKRDTRAMMPLPHLEPDIGALHAYLNP